MSMYQFSWIFSCARNQVMPIVAFCKRLVASYLWFAMHCRATYGASGTTIATTTARSQAIPPRLCVAIKHSIERVVELVVTLC